MGQLAKTQVFDYGQIEDKDVRGKLTYFAGTIRKKKIAGTALMLEIGADLLASQDLMANQKNGVFLSWLDLECDYSQRTAYNFISAARVFGNITCKFCTLSDSAMYLLAASNCPPPATEEALNLQKQGKPVTHKIAKQLISKYTIAAESSTPSTQAADSTQVDELPQVAESAMELLSKLKPTDEQLTALAQYEEESQIELAESVASGIQSLDQAVETGDVPEESAQQVMDRINKAIESHCRALKKLFASCPDDPWMEHADYKKNALADLDLCCKQLRLAKCKHVCPDCEGAGCKHCLETGRMPDHRYKQMAIQ